MKCSTCGSWTDVLETRQLDTGLTLRRRRQCANGHRFDTFEVLAPIYRRDPPTVRQTIVAAQVRATTWLRDRLIVKAFEGDQAATSARTVTRASLAAEHGITEAAVKKVIERWRRRERGTVKSRP